MNPVNRKLAEPGRAQGHPRIILGWFPRLLLGCFGLVLLGVVVSSCDMLATEPPSDNDPPNTTLANVPVEGDTLFALLTLHWDGEDNDGFVAGYEYRYVTKYVFQGDSVATDWEETDQTSLTIAFNSNDDLNEQVFQVRAVDNEGAADPEPAEKRFYTRKTIFPETEIAAPAEGEQYFYLDQTSDWWEGVPLTFTANDEDGEVVEYGWAVDDDDWTWTTDTTLFVGPEHFGGEGEHTLRVAARDNTNLLDPEPAEVTVQLIRPQFDREILIIDETLEEEFPSQYETTDEEVDAFYADIFGTDDSWDYGENGLPPKDVLGRYRLVVWHADNNFSLAGNAHKLPEHIDEVSDYMNVGGDLIMSGWRMLKSFAPADDFPRAFEPGSFVNDYLHIQAANETDITIPGDFIGATGVGDAFTDVAVDSTKLDDAFPYFGWLAQINVIPERAGFTDVIYSYQSRGEQPLFRGSAVGLRYYGTSFDAVVLGFPILFLEEDDARTLADEVLTSLGYR